MTLITNIKKKKKYSKNMKNLNFVFFFVVAGDISWVIRQIYVAINQENRTIRQSSEETG